MPDVTGLGAFTESVFSACYVPANDLAGHCADGREIAVQNDVDVPQNGALKCYLPQFRALHADALDAAVLRDLAQFLDVQQHAAVPSLGQSGLLIQDSNAGRDSTHNFRAHLCRRSFWSKGYVERTGSKSLNDPVGSGGSGPAGLERL